MRWRGHGAPHGQHVEANLRCNSVSGRIEPNPVTDLESARAGAGVEPESSQKLVPIARADGEEKVLTAVEACCSISGAAGFAAAWRS
jgi:hypothetical protein